jgi:pentatricopeptide repeat protein
VDVSSIKTDSQASSKLIESIRDLTSSEEPRRAKGDEVLLNVLLDSCINCNQVDTALELFESIDSHSFFKPDEVTFNTLIKGCAIEKRLSKALWLFDLMRSSYKLQPNDVTYNSLIDVCIRCDKPEKAWSLFHQMAKDGLKPDNYTCSTLVKGVMPD